MKFNQNPLIKCEDEPWMARNNLHHFTESVLYKQCIRKENIKPKVLKWTLQPLGFMQYVISKHTEPSLRWQSDKLCFTLAKSSRSNCNDWSFKERSCSAVWLVVRTCEVRQGVSETVCSTFKHLTNMQKVLCPSLQLARNSTLSWHEHLIHRYLREFNIIILDWTLWKLWQVESSIEYITGHLSQMK